MVSDRRKAAQIDVVLTEDPAPADESGIIVIPNERPEEIMELAGRIHEQEARLEAQVIGEAMTAWDDV